MNSMKRCRYGQIMGRFLSQETNKKGYKRKVIHMLKEVSQLNHLITYTDSGASSYQSRFKKPFLNNEDSQIHDR
jgi:hypothetical protein